MEQKKLFDILLKVSELRMDIETAAKRILLLFDVSSNEAHSIKYKKVGEVAVCECEKPVPYVYDVIHKKQCLECLKEIQTDC